MAYELGNVFALLDNWVEKYGTRFILGLSGGGDSFALLEICKTWLETPNAIAKKAQIFPVIIDHNIADNSAKVAQFAYYQAVNMGFAPQIFAIEHKILTSIEENARLERFRLLKQAAINQKANGILIAHNYGDRIETLLFRMARGSDIFGMCGIRPEAIYEFQRTEGVILRPLLQFRRNELREICKQNHIKFYNDPANDSLDYSRVKLRKWLIENEINEAALINIAEKCADIRAFYEESCLRFIGKYCTCGTNFITINYIAFNELPPSLKEFILGKTLQAIGKTDYQPRREKIKNLILKINIDFKGATLNNCALKLTRDAISIKAAPQRKNGGISDLNKAVRDKNALNINMADKLRILCNIKSPK